MEWKAISYGRAHMSEDRIVINGCKGRLAVIEFMFYYVRTEGRHILVDVGCDTMPDFDMWDFIGPVKALKVQGVDPACITDVLITHAHHDHIDGLRHFPQAAVYIQRDEYAEGKAYIPEGATVHCFEEEFRLCDGVRIVKIGGHSIGSCVVELESDEGKFVICGDECYQKRCLVERVPTGASVCLSKSKAFLERYADSEYQPLLCHER